MLSALTAILSNLVSNVPAVLVLRPFIDNLSDPTRAWLTVAMSSTLAGNLTVLGSIANLIVVQRAAASGITIGFWDYCRVGVPLTSPDIADRDTLALALIGAWTSVRSRATRFHPASLDALNFLLADVRGALGPYLNVFLVTIERAGGRTDCRSLRIFRSFHRGRGRGRNGAVRVDHPDAGNAEDH